jgi:hypothetical protein
MADPDEHYLLLYDYVPNMAERRAPFRDAHRARINAERDAGNLRVAGAFDPPTGGALVFKGVEREHVEEFARADPYLEAGLISAWRVQRWLLV